MTESAERELPELESQKKLAVQARNFDEAQRVSEAVKTLSAAKETNVAKKETVQAEIATKEAANAEALAQLKALQERKDELNGLLTEGKSAIKKPKEEKHKEPSCFAKFMKSTFVQVLTNAANGVMTVTLYFADLVSDLQVVQLMFDTGNFWWGVVSAFILIAQFIAVYVRVIPYLGNNFGTDSLIYILFVWLGFPWGCLVLDALMFLEPFGLLTVLPLPDWLRQFVPAYKATRIIAEVSPRCTLMLDAPCPIHLACLSFTFQSDELKHSLPPW